MWNLNKHTMNITFSDSNGVQAVEIHARPIKSPTTRRLHHRNTYRMEEQRGGGFILFGLSKSGAKIPVGWRGDKIHARQTIIKLNSGKKP